jgi:hypothetical protein
VFRRSDCIYERNNIEIEYNNKQSICGEKRRRRELNTPGKSFPRYDIVLIYNQDR